jgi:SOS-response transcriptional repressor LexA
VASHLRAMQRKGYVSPNPTTARAISFNWKAYL